MPLIQPKMLDWAAIGEYTNLCIKLMTTLIILKWYPVTSKQHSIYAIAECNSFSLQAEFLVHMS